MKDTSLIGEIGVSARKNAVVVSLLEPNEALTKRLRSLGPQSLIQVAVDANETSFFPPLPPSEESDPIRWLLAIAVLVIAGTACFLWWRNRHRRRLLTG
jgi:hypothetical protein